MTPSRKHHAGLLRSITVKRASELQAINKKPNILDSTDGYERWRRNTQEKSRKWLKRGAYETNMHKERGNFRHDASQQNEPNEEVLYG